MFHLQKSEWRKHNDGELINLQGTRCWEGHTKNDLWKASHTQQGIRCC